jgi:hypothetical protein
VRYRCGPQWPGFSLGCSRDEDETALNLDRLFFGPHGGLGIGLNRVLMVLLHLESMTVQLMIGVGPAVIPDPVLRRW